MVFACIFILVSASLIVATFFDLKDEARIRDINSLDKICR